MTCCVHDGKLRNFAGSAATCMASAMRSARRSGVKSGSGLKWVRPTRETLGMAGREFKFERAAAAATASAANLDL